MEKRQDVIYYYCCGGNRNANFYKHVKNGMSSIKDVGFYNI